MKLRGIQYPYLFVWNISWYLYDHRNDSNIFCVRTLWLYVVKESYTVIVVLLMVAENIV